MDRSATDSRFDAGRGGDGVERRGKSGMRADWRGDESRRPLAASSNVRDSFDKWGQAQVGGKLVGIVEMV